MMLGGLRAEAARGFLFEALEACRVGGEFAGQDFDGHRPPEASVARAEDLPHPARTNPRDDLVGSESRTGSDGHAVFSIVVC